MVINIFIRLPIPIPIYFNSDKEIIICLLYFKNNQINCLNKFKKTNSNNKNLILNNYFYAYKNINI